MLYCLESAADTVCAVFWDETKKPEELIGKSKKSGIYFLGSTKKMDHPAPVLSSKAVREFIALMREKMDYIIIDSPQ